MTKPISASERGLDPYFKVRVVLPGVLLHLASRSEPVVHFDYEDCIRDVEADWIRDSEYGDTLGHIAWREVTALTWRWSP
jgi:uncharacterized membrane protein